MANRDVLICGNCNLQFSDLKVFIDHKQSCTSNITPISNGVEMSSVATAHPSTVASQQIPLVSLPVGMPHVILQSSSGLPQMYRFVLEPSLTNQNSLSTTGPISTTTSTSQSNLVYAALQPSNMTVVDTQFATTQASVDKNDTKHVCTGNKVELCSIKTSISNGGTPSTVSLSDAPLIVSQDRIDSWLNEGVRTESQQRLFESLPNKGLLGGIGSSLNADEEDVATILATQLVGKGNTSSIQATDELPTLQENKTREQSSVVKYCDISNQTSSNDQINADRAFVTIGLMKSVDDLGLVTTTMAPPAVIANDIKNTTKLVQMKGITDTKPVLHYEEVIEKGVKKVRCTFAGCSFSTSHKKDMVRHVRKHTGEKPYSCTQCGSRFSRQDKLAAHLRTHARTRPHACTVSGCNYRASEKGHLQKHMRVHNDERPFRCQFCPYAARDGSHLTVHLRSHTGDAPFECEISGCSATFKTSSDLKRHLRLHSGQKPFKCSQCDYASALKSNLKVHFRINHLKGEKFSCKECVFESTSRRQARAHHKTHTTAANGTPSISVMSTDSTVVAPRPRRRPAAATCRKNYACNRCSAQFVRIDSLRAHLRQHDRMDAAATADSAVISSNEIPLVSTQTQQGVEVSQVSSEFPTYMITIDGISSVYSSPPPPTANPSISSVEVHVIAPTPLQNNTTRESVT